MPGKVQACVADAVTPESVPAVVELIPSPQLNAYTSVSASASVVTAEYWYSVEVRPLVGPDVKEGVAGTVLETPEDGCKGLLIRTCKPGYDWDETAPRESVART